jgi:ribonuclease HI
LSVIAEVEDLEKTLARFPGLSREELIAVLLGKKARQLSLLDVPSKESPKKTEPRVAAPGTTVDAVRLWTDGASRGNPGPASVGVVIQNMDGEVVAEVAQAIGTRTNNVAEYEAVRLGLARALELGATKAMLHADSELVVRQLNGMYRVRNADLLPLFEAVKALEARFSRGVTYKHVRREQNADADRLANLALDNA